VPQRLPGGCIEAWTVPASLAIVRHLGIVPANLILSEWDWPEPGGSAMATYVLVPGSHVGGWSWNRVAPLLRAAGHDVFTPTPTGLGERAHLAQPGIDLATHITDVANLLFYEDLADVTLVGWSSGVMTITGVAEQAPERLRQLVYLDTLPPTDGQSEFDALETSPAAREAERAAGEAAGVPGVSPIPAAYVRAQIADQAWFLARTAPRPLACFAQPVRFGNPAAAALPRAFVYLSAAKDPADPTPRFAARIRADPTWRYREVAANHLAPVTDPAALADTLLALV
jgi:pimeloyl-ACP methyl ester carboxylesterase